MLCKSIRDVGHMHVQQKGTILYHETSRFDGYVNNRALKKYRDHTNYGNVPFHEYASFSNIPKYSFLFSKIKDLECHVDCRIFHHQLFHK